MIKPPGGPTLVQAPTSQKFYLPEPHQILRLKARDESHASGRGKEKLTIMKYV